MVSHGTDSVLRATDEANSFDEQRQLVLELMKEVGSQMSFIKGLVEIADNLHAKRRYKERDQILSIVGSLIENNKNLNQIAKRVDVELREL